MDFVADDWGIDLARQGDVVLSSHFHDLTTSASSMCSDCHQTVSNPDQRTAHIDGDSHKRVVDARRHREEMMAAGREYPNERWCDLCGALCVSMKEYANHLKGSRHRAARKVHLRLWALRIAIMAVSAELRRREVPLPNMLPHAAAVMATCAVCPSHLSSVDEQVETKAVAWGTAGPVVPAGPVAGGCALASTAIARAELTASEPSAEQGSPTGVEGDPYRRAVSMRAEVADVVVGMNELRGAVSSMTESMDATEVSLRNLRHEVERREDLIDQTAERVRAIERMVKVSRKWQSKAEEAIKAIQERG